MSEQITDLLVKRGALRERRFTSPPMPELGEGQALLRVDCFALTANTVTYAAFGEAMRYWDFFPPAEHERAAWGRPPCWGFGDVVASRAEGVREGARYYGSFPIGTHLVVDSAARGAGFVDAAAHRAALPKFYNAYTAAPASAPDDEAMAMLLRPLFATAFLLDDYLADAEYFGASRVVLSSASSKTALGLAWLLKARGDVEVIGLTSPTSTPFLERADVYDRVIPYAEAPALAGDVTTTYVDFSGAAALRARLHTLLGAALRHDCVVGAADWSAVGETPADLPGVRPAFFFAPAIAEQRAAQWGLGVLESKLGAASADFFAAARPWIKITRGEGRDAVDKAWIDAVDGRTPPDAGVILRL